VRSGWHEGGDAALLWAVGAMSATGTWSVDPAIQLLLFWLDPTYLPVGKAGSPGSHAQQAQQAQRNVPGCDEYM
jgi:hypothetical protein